jgi:hypothetical protein
VSKENKKNGYCVLSVRKRSHVLFLFKACIAPFCPTRHTDDLLLGLTIGHVYFSQEKEDEKYKCGKDGKATIIMLLF